MAERPPLDDRLRRYLAELSAYPMSPALDSRLVAAPPLRRPHRFLAPVASLGIATAAAGALAGAVLVAHRGGHTPGPVLVPSTPISSSPSPTPRTSATPSPSGSPVPSPSAPPVLSGTARILITTAVHGSNRDLDLLRPDGSRVATLTIPLSSPPVVAAGRVDYLDDSGHLWSIDGTGRQTDHGSLGSNTAAYGIAVSPDGSRWAWASQTTQQVGAGHTTLHVGGPGLPTTTVDEVGQPSSVWVPIAWRRAGILLAEERIGIGGCCYLSPEYGRFAGRLLDPSTLQARELLAGCQPSDLRDDGTYACASTGPHTGPVLVRADGSKVPIAVPAAQIGAGWLSFTPDGGSLAVGLVVTRGSGGSAGPYDVRTYIADAGSGSVRLVGAHMLPDGWLADGRLVVSEAPAALARPPAPVLSIVGVGGAVSAIGRGDVFAVIP